MHKCEGDTELSNEQSVRRRAAPNPTGGDEGMNVHRGASERSSVSLTA